MKTLLFDYEMKIVFDAPVSDHRFTVRCIPLDSERQKIRKLSYSIYPDSSLETGFSQGTDSFGNFCVYGECSRPHEHFSIQVKGEAVSGLSDHESAEALHMLGRFRYPSHYTRPGENLLAYHRKFTFPDSDTAMEKSIVMMRRLYRDFLYVPGATSVSTTAEEAMTLGRGVCQDYSHILIALCHMERIPARYVVGMLEGEGASHAWVEIYDRGSWYALDPTNNLIVSDSHIKISHGRDYKDCLINQGVFTGQAGQRQEIYVSVKEEEKRSGENDTNSDTINITGG